MPFFFSSLSFSIFFLACCFKKEESKKKCKENRFLIDRSINWLTVSFSGCIKNGTGKKFLFFFFRRDFDPFVAVNPEYIFLSPSLSFFLFLSTSHTHAFSILFLFITTSFGFRLLFRSFTTLPISCPAKVKPSVMGNGRSRGFKENF